MGIIAKLLGKAPQEETARVGGMEDFMTLVRVYFQASLASRNGHANGNQQSGRTTGPAHL